MSDLEKKQKITNSCVDYSATSCPEVPLAEVFEPNYSTTEGITHFDQFGEEKRLPAHLNLHAPVRFFSTSARGIPQSRTVSLAELIKEASHLATARNQLLQMIQSRGADEDVKNRSFDIREDNILEILSQLTSSSKEARQAGAQALDYFIRRGTSDKNLQRGILRTIDEIRTPEALQVLKEVYKKAPELRAELEKLPTHGSYLKHQANAIAQTTKNESITPSVSNFTSVGGTVALSSSALVTDFKPDLPLPSSFIVSLVKSLEVQVHRSPILKPLFDETTYEQIAERLSRTAQGVEKNLEKLAPYLRLAILGDAWKNPFFSLPQFSELSRTTNQWVRNSLTSFLDHHEVTTTHVQPGAKQEYSDITSRFSPEPNSTNLEKFSHAQKFSQSVSEKIYSINQVTTTESKLNPLSANLAGLQGASAQGFYGLANSKVNFNHAQSHEEIVEPVGGLEEGEQGFSQNSGEGSEQKNSREGSQEEQENYLA